MANDRLQLDGVLSEGYGIIPRKVMKVKGISLGAKGLYGYFCSCAGQDRECFPSRETICNDLDISRDSFSKYLGELKKKKYLIVEQVKENGRFLHNVYHLPLNDAPCLEFPCPKISAAEKTVSENSVSENSAPINNNNIFTNNNITNNTPYNPPTAAPTVDYSPAEESAGDTPHAEEVEPEPVSPKKGGRKKRGASADDGKKTYGEHGNVRLTDEELEKLRERYPDDYLGKITALSRYIWQHHAERRYKDHYRTLLVWLKDDADRPKGKGGGGNAKPLEMSSFDTDEFYKAAVKRSYGNVDMPGA